MKPPTELSPALATFDVLHRTWKSDNLAERARASNLMRHYGWLPEEYMVRTPAERAALLVYGHPLHAGLTPEDIDHIAKNGLPDISLHAAACELLTGYGNLSTKLGRYLISHLLRRQGWSPSEYMCLDPEARANALVFGGSGKRSLTEIEIRDLINGVALTTDDSDLRELFQKLGFK